MIAMKMIQICGVRTFLTTPAIVAVMIGPLTVIGLDFGAVLALADSLVWAELCAAMPGAAHGSHSLKFQMVRKSARRS
jgi:hypothetical protein